MCGVQWKRMNISMMQIPLMILRTHLISFSTRSLNSISETNLSGLEKGCRQPSKSDQVSDLNEEANLTQKVPELNETHLVEGKRMLQNAGDCHGDNHFCLLSNMMEEETHIVDNISDQEGIYQILFDEIDTIKDQSYVSKSAGIAISGLSQSNQWRLSKSDGEHGTPLPATKSDRQNQKVGLGNLSQNTPKEVMGNLFHDIYCCSKCVSMVIGTLYRNYHRPALIIIFVFQNLSPKILRTSSQERTCPTRTYACLAKHYSK